ncbi:hypothetical protein V3481_010589 [Fusarium oxysporum f. sp. vasinfectum]
MLLMTWTDVEPLVMGLYGENGAEAPFDDHTPQFVAKVWIIRQGTTAPKGWIKVQDVGPYGDIWRQQLFKTWNAVRCTVKTIQDSPDDCPYSLCQIYIASKGTWNALVKQVFTLPTVPSCMD